MMKTIDFISLGCSKNLVDSENLMGMFEAKNFHVTHDSDNPKGEVVVVNTCGFIADAKEESINTILEQVARKNEGKVQKIFVMGCLSERYLADLEAERANISDSADVAGGDGSGFDYYADKIEELKTVCWCGDGATCNARIDKNGKIVRKGKQIELGGNDRYISLCKKHYYSGETGKPK